MSFLFDTDAISEILKKKPAPDYIEWLSEVPPEKQFASAVTFGELFRGAFRSSDPHRHLRNIDLKVLPVLTVLPYDFEVSRVYGRLHAGLSESGSLVEDADLQIAATAVHHGLQVVTGNLRHFERIPGLKIHRVLAEAKANRG